MEDEKSKNTFLKVIEGRLTADLDIAKQIYQKDQYWPSDVIKFDKDETIIECGSSDGKTLRDMCDKLENNFHHIYCFEPDSQCQELLEGVIQQINSKNPISVIDKGVYKETATLCFENEKVDSGLSKVSDAGNAKIQVVALDEVMKEKVTYIKMDIEGGEYDALLGAAKIISSDKPKLAICVYHKDEDIINIPNLLKSLNPDYHFFMRHHNINMTETVLYAI